MKKANCSFASDTENHFGSPKFPGIYLPACADEVRSDVLLFPQSMITRPPRRAQAVFSSRR